MDIDKELLQKLYWEDGLSAKAIAEKLGMIQWHVYYQMKRYDIPRRPRKQKGQSISEHQRKALIASLKRYYIKHPVSSGSCHHNWKGGKVTVYCAICNKPIGVASSRLKRSKQFFCSRKHFAQGQSERMKGERVEYIDVPCGYCNKTLHVRKGRLTNSKSGYVFCSNKHWSWWYRDNVRGPNHWAWKGGYIPLYGPNWEEQRQGTLERDNHTCQVCGKTEAEEGRQLSIHHIVPFRDFGYERYKEANHPSNLLTVCNSCHGPLHYQN